MSGFWAAGFWADGFWSPGFWGESQPSAQELQEPFDAPYQEYVTRISAERAAEWRRKIEGKNLDVSTKVDQQYDSPAGRGAPGKGESHVIRSVAPSLSRSNAQIRIAPIRTSPFPSTSVEQRARRPIVGNDDDAEAMLVMFIMTVDDD